MRCSPRHRGPASVVYGWASDLDGARQESTDSLETSLWRALTEVLLVNLVLSGDNAVVIGLAARDLPAGARRRAVMIGGGLAVLLRLALTVPAESLLDVPLVRAAGGILLLWIAYRLLTEDQERVHRGEAGSVTEAIRLIVLADLTMSLDNILAVAAVADRSPHSLLVVVFGLALSIPIVLLGGGIVAWLMQRLPILAWVGAAVLASTAAELITDDVAIDQYLDQVPHLRPIAAIGAVVVLLGLAWWRARRHAGNPPAATPSAGRPARDRPVARGR